MRVHTNPAPDIASPGIHVLSTSNDPRFPDEPVSHHLLDFKAGHLSHSRWPEGRVRDSRVVYGMDWATNAQYAASLGRGRQDRLIYLVRFRGATPEELTQEQLYEIGQTGKLPSAPVSAARHNPKPRTASRLPASLRPPKPIRRGLPDVPPPTRDQVEATLKSLHRDEFLAAMKRLMGQITAEEERNIYNYDEKELAKAIILAAVSGVPLETVTRGVAAKMVRQELNWVCDHAGAWLPGQKLLLDCIQRMKAELPRISSSKKAWSAERKRDVMARQEEMEEYMDTHGGWSSDPKSRHYRWTPE